MAELSELLNLQQKYGVVAFLGTAPFNHTHELVFQSDNPMEAMSQMERLSIDDNGERGYRLIIQKSDAEKRRP